MRGEGKRDGDWGVSPVGIRRKHRARGKRGKKKIYGGWGMEMAEKTMDGWMEMEEGTDWTVRDL